jgi:hypothetical protein
MLVDDSGPRDEEARVRVLLDEEVRVDHCWMFLAADDADLDLVAAREGALNGALLAGAGDMLAMITGLHLGDVPLRIELHDTRPPPGAEWEDVVEAPLRTTDDRYVLSTAEFGAELELPGATDLRARWCASGVDAAYEGTRATGDPVLDRYLLQLWPARRRRETVVRVTSSRYRHAHEEARRTAATAAAVAAAAPPVSRAEVRELARRRVQTVLEGVAAGHRADEERADRQRWGVWRPSPALRSAGARAPQLTAAAPVLAERVAALGPAAQRALAVHCARHACASAGLAHVPEIDALLAALGSGRSVEPPAWDTVRAWATGPAPADPGRASVVQLAVGRPPAPHRPVDPVAVAVDTVVGAAQPDPAEAAVWAVDACLRGAGDLGDRVGEIAAWLPS